LREDPPVKKTCNPAPRRAWLFGGLLLLSLTASAAPPDLNAGDAAPAAATLPLLEQDRTCGALGMAVNGMYLLARRQQPNALDHDGLLTRTASALLQLYPAYDQPSCSIALPPDGRRLAANALKTAHAFADAGDLQDWACTALISGAYLVPVLADGDAAFDREQTNRAIGHLVYELMKPMRPQVRAELEDCPVDHLAESGVLAPLGAGAAYRLGATQPAAWPTLGQVAN
jgi:hypothetical protein